PEHGTDAAALIRRAAAAMEQARRRGEPVLVYDPEFDAEARARLTLLGELRQALAGGQIVAYFQPQVDPFTGAVGGVEALVRWQHPERGLIPPVAFLDVAQRSGLMRALTERVLALSLERAAAWRAAGTPVGVSVNVAAPNLLDRGFPAHVADALQAAGLPPGALTLEITEDVVMAESDQALEDLHRLRALGVRLSLDDFGTGHSSLAKLKGLPIQELKIDRSFVRRITEDAGDLAIVETTVRLARSFGLSVVAEGVEDDAAWVTLAELGCDTLQGYRIARPLPPEEIDAWLARAPVGTPLPGSVRRPAAGAAAARLRAGSARPPR
ncbi:MAG TPA: EAL domain-containing protein, partial [Solirubrobacteraceae bacterium]|nr:EAL domain-containing protein [Solirubrobacteraceae bacterium]